MPGNTVDVLNCSIESLQLAMLNTDQRIKSTSILSSTGRSLSMWIFAELSEYAIPSAGLGNRGSHGNFCNYGGVPAPYLFANNAEQWYEFGVATQHFSKNSEQPQLYPYGTPMLMNGALVDMYTSQKQKCITEFQSFPPSDIELAQQTVEEIIDRYIVEQKPPEDS